jgi:hypothetical protein
LLGKYQGDLLRIRFTVAVKSLAAIAALIAGTFGGLQSSVAAAGVVPGVPTGFNFYAGDRILIGYVKPPANDGGSPVDGYVVNYRKAGSPHWTTAISSAPTGTVLDVDNSTVYEMRIAARNASGVGRFTSVLQAYTHPIVAGNGFYKVEPGVGSATASWIDSPRLGGTLLGLVAEVRPVGVEAFTLVSDEPVSPLVVEGLTPGREYELRLTITTTGGSNWATHLVTPKGVLPTPGFNAPITSVDGELKTAPVASVPTGAIATKATPTGLGSWSVAKDGGVFTAGDAPFFGSMGGKLLNAPITGISSTATGAGYYLVASDGGIFSYGDATFHGSMGGHALNQPMVSLTATPTGQGYYTLAKDGGVFAFGDARFHGSLGSTPLNGLALGVVPTSTGGGYWLFAADGGVFAFGDAPFVGSLGGNPPAGGVVGMIPSPNGGGYWLVGKDGKTYAFNV